MDPLKKAEELGIENAESLTPKQLEKAITSAEKAIAAAALAKKKAADELAKLHARATELGMDHEGVSADDLKTAIDEEEAAIAEKAAHEATTLANSIKIGALLSFLSLDQETFEEMSKEELEKYLESRDTGVANSSNADDILAENEGKSDKTFAGSNKKQYQFTQAAPASFRFAGVVKTQSEWIEDKDAMEIMVQGNLSYLKTVKK